MFHAVNQMTSEELGSPGTGALPMFREENSSSAGRGGSSSGISSNGPSRRTGAGGGSGPADATGGSAMALEMRPLHHGGGAAARRRRSGQLKDLTGGRAAVTSTASPSGSNHPVVAFAGPDGVDAGGFAEAGTFRWDATVADAATAQQDGLGEDGMEEEGGGGSGSNSRRSRAGGTGAGGSRRGVRGLRRGKLALSPPMSGDMADIAHAARYHKPWYIITPESKMHQIFDHTGEPLCVFLVGLGQTTYVYILVRGWRARRDCCLSAVSSVSLLRQTTRRNFAHCGTYEYTSQQSFLTVPQHWDQPHGIRTRPA